MVDAPLHGVHRHWRTVLSHGEVRACPELSRFPGPGFAIGHFSIHVEADRTLQGIYYLGTLEFYYRGTSTWYACVHEHVHVVHVHVPLLLRVGVIFMVRASTGTRMTNWQMCKGRSHFRSDGARARACFVG